MNVVIIRFLVGGFVVSLFAALGMFSGPRVLRGYSGPPLRLRWQQ
jgi:hypothetical protein